MHSLTSLYRSDAQVVHTFLKCVGKIEQTLDSVMHYGSAFHILTDEDAHAIVRYLRSIPPVHNPLPQNANWQPPAE